jgi:hypothetical protein
VVKVKLIKVNLTWVLGWEPQHQVLVEAIQGLPSSLAPLEGRESLLGRVLPVKVNLTWA